MLVKDMLGNPIDIGDIVIKHCDDDTKHQATVVGFQNSKTVNKEGWWVDIVFDGKKESSPSYILENLKKPKTAEQRGSEMMMIPTKDLPEEAFSYAANLCRQHGMCGEVLLTAYVHYAQCVEGLKCTDPLYMADISAYKFFGVNCE